MLFQTYRRLTTLRRLTMLAVVALLGCGSNGQPDESCSTKPFGTRYGTECGGTAHGWGTFTFGSKDDVKWMQAGPYDCTLDWSGCKVLMHCPYDAQSSYEFTLTWSEADDTLKGTVDYQGQTTCVTIAP